MTADASTGAAKMPNVVVGIELGMPLPEILDRISRTLARESVRILGSHKAAAHALGISRRSLSWYLEGARIETPESKSSSRGK